MKRNSSHTSHPDRRLPAVLRLLCGVLAALPILPAFAVEDTGTPGAGAWEINLEAVGERTRDGWEVAAPNMEVNYGVGEHGQLLLAAPWKMSRAPGGTTRSGLGAATAGIKWRFVDQEDAGFSVSVFPQYSWSVLSSSVRRGIASPNHELLLPLQLGIERAGLEVTGELARNLVEHGDGEWLAGLKASNACSSTATCRIELQHNYGTAQTFAMLGIKLKIGEGAFLRGTLGRDFGEHVGDQRTLVASFGIQLVR